MADSIKVEGLDAFAQASRLLPQNVGMNVLRGRRLGGGTSDRD